MNSRHLRIQSCLWLLVFAFCALTTTPTFADEPEKDSDSDVQLAIAADKAHAELFLHDRFPSAAKCATCHPKHYREWSVSPHAYGQLSPIFNAMSNKLIKQTSGTQGDFCIRCHTPVGMALGEPINISNLDRHPASREGVTCVNCHRINQAWGKGAGRQSMTEGDVNAPISGSIGSRLLQEALDNPDEYGPLKTTASAERGRVVHASSERFFQLTTSGFCGSCHDVFAPNGFRLEDAFSEFKNSPSAKIDGHNCQDCHMSQTPGTPGGYSIEPAAIVGNRETPPRKHTNHMIIGPDYSIIHRGLFPHNPKAVREESDVDQIAKVTDYKETEYGLATMREWLKFDDAGGWGTERFEKSPHGRFPAEWKSKTKRIKARKILDEQGQLLEEAAFARLTIMQAGYKLSNICVDETGQRGLKFHVNVHNGTRGHGVPTGFDAERLVFLRVRVWNPQGRLVYQSGDLDPNGDVRDSHSFFVHNGKMPLDRDLFSVQTRFVTRNLRGGEREQILAVPYSIDPLPYIRPETRPFTILGRPVAARKHKQNIEVLGSRRAEYKVTAKNACVPGAYTIRVQLIAGMVPVNLIHEISDVGFDYGLSAKEIADRVVAGHMIVHDRTTRAFVK